MKSNFPRERVELYSESIKPFRIFSGATIFVQTQQDTPIAHLFAERLSHALQAKGFNSTSKDDANYLLLFSYNEDISHNNFQLKVDIISHVHSFSEDRIWRGIAQINHPPSCDNTMRNGYLTVYHSSNPRGEFDFLWMDYLIAAIINNIGKSVSSDALILHPSQFPYLSQATPPLFPMSGDKETSPLEK